MSHLGLKVLYSIVNARPGLAAERAFAPWPDMEGLLRSSGEPLRTLESGTPLSGMDIVGFSLQYELCATSVLQMLDLGGIPLRSEERGNDDPFVIGGGPLAFNPVPLAPFFDALAIGDGEELILEMAASWMQWKEHGGSREELLKEWKNLDGVYIPVLHSPGETVSRRIVADLDGAEFPTELVVPYCEAVHDRIGVEIARGCTRGCRFCQAGMLYRPVREREAATILDVAEKSIRATGWDEVALLSLSSGDHSCIGGLIRTMVEDFGPDKVAISLPSLRTETLNAKMAEDIRKVRKTGFTLAPEAGSDKLRRVINKGNTEEDMENAIRAAFGAGWKAVKLYFMIGLPRENDEDLEGIVDLVRKASKWTGRGKITASVSTFVPKCHTPFQWEAQLSVDETGRRQRLIRGYFGNRGTRVKFHDPRTSLLEGVIARGDREVTKVIEAAFEGGARLDGWNEHLKFDVWMEAFSKCGVDPQEYLKAVNPEAALPWDLIDTGVSREFLLQERARAYGEEPTGDCRFGDCEGCGVCDFHDILPRTAETKTVELRRPRPSGDGNEEPRIRKFRLRYAKIKDMRLLGHHDLVRTFYRAMRRAGIKPDYSQGFHPHPKLRFSNPLSVGLESIAEYVDMDVVGWDLGQAELFQAFALELPDGLQPLELEEITLNDSPISDRIRRVTYRIAMFDEISAEEVSARLEAFRACSSLEISKMRKGKTRTRDLKHYVESIEVTGPHLTMTLQTVSSTMVNPVEAAAAILGVSREKMKTMKILKTSVEFEASSETS
jgi:radical SAM family uncharacterized protein/radical SAM-linked protein